MVIEKLTSSLKFTSFSFLTILFGILFSEIIFAMNPEELIINNLSIITLIIFIFSILFGKFSFFLKEKNIFHYGILFLIGLFVATTSIHFSVDYLDNFSKENIINHLNNVVIFFSILSGLFFLLYLIFKNNTNLFVKYAYSIPFLGFLSSSALILFYFKLAMIPSIVMCISLAIIFFVFYLNIKEESTDINNKSSERKIFWSSLLAILMFLPPI